MRGAAEVGRGTFVGYHPEQSDRPVGGEPEHSSQSQDPQLSKQVRSEMGSLHLTLSGSNYTDSTQSKRKSFEILQLTPVPWPADRRAQAGDRPHVPTAQLHLQHATVSQCEISSPAVQPLSRVHDMRHFARKNQNIEERWATSLRNDRGEL